MKNFNNFIIPYIIISLFIIFALIDKHKDLDKNLHRLKQDSLKFTRTINKLKNESAHYVIGTFYNPLQNQCDNTPLETADGTIIDINELNNHKLRYIAISRDLQDKFSLGDTIIVHCNNKNLTGVWIIRDLMNKRIKNKIDFLLPVHDTFNITEPLPLKITKYKQY